MHREPLALRMARQWVDARTVTRVFEPLVADWEHERRGQTGRARVWTDAAWSAAVLRSVASAVSAQCVRPLPGGAFGAGLATLTLGTAAGTAVMLTNWQEPAFLIPYLLPSLLMSALLAAVLPASAATLSPGRAPAWERHTAALRLALLCTMLAAVSMEWAVPGANQKFRQALATHYGRPVPPRGVRELRTSELFSRAPITAQDQAVSGMALVPHPWVLAERHNRLAIIASPAVYALLGGVIGARLRRRRLLAGALWLASIGAMLFSQQLQRGYGAPGAWAALVIYLLIAVLVGILRPLRAEGLSTSASRPSACRPSRA